VCHVTIRPVNPYGGDCWCHGKRDPCSAAQQPCKHLASHELTNEFATKHRLQSSHTVRSTPNGCTVDAWKSAACTGTTGAVLRSKESIVHSGSSVLATLGLTTECGAWEQLLQLHAPHE